MTYSLAHSIIQCVDLKLEKSLIDRRDMIAARCMFVMVAELMSPTGKLMLVKEFTKAIDECREADEKRLDI